MKLIAVVAGACFFLFACKPEKKPTPPPANSPASEVAASGAAMFIGVGDIGVCGMSGDEQTAQLADSILVANQKAGVTTAVFTLGDNAYPAGLDRDFVRCFKSSWGDPGKHIMALMHPSIGNHDYQSERGAAYYRFFGVKAGPALKGYYSYDFADWHMIALNSETVASGTEKERLDQEQWLTRDLKSSGKLCSIAYFHRPLFSSGVHGEGAEMRKIWQILYDGGVDLVLSGHDHDYERFLPQTPAGVLDTVRGIPEIVAGTGGGPLTGIRNQLMPNSAARIQGHWGLLLLTLGAKEYRSVFLEVGGRLWDPSGGRCH